jgi:hypothetical protein
MDTEESFESIDDFIGRYIHSVEQLEILSLLSRTPEQAWSVNAIFQVIRSSESSIEECLRRFVLDGLAVKDPSGMYRFDVRERKMAHLVAETVTAYRERPVAVISLVYRAGPSTTAHETPKGVAPAKEKNPGS